MWRCRVSLLEQEITECRHVIKFANETLKPAVINSIMANLNIFTRKQLEKMLATQLIDVTMKIQENKISSQNELFHENKKSNEKLTDIQSKFDKLASDNEILQSKIIVAEKTTNTLQENLSSNNSKITDLERSFHKLEQYSHRECVEIAGIPHNVPHLISF